MPSAPIRIHPPKGLAVTAVAAWGVLATTALLISAIVRLTPMALEPLRSHDMSGLQWALYIGWAIFNGYVEGYRGFQLRFCPRVVARAVHLGRNPRLLHVLLAAGFAHYARCMRR